MLFRSEALTKNQKEDNITTPDFIKILTILQNNGIDLIENKIPTSGIQLDEYLNKVNGKRAKKGKEKIDKEKIKQALTDKGYKYDFNIGTTLSNQKSTHKKELKTGLYEAKDKNGKRIFSDETIEALTYVDPRFSHKKNEEQEEPSIVEKVNENMLIEEKANEELTKSKLEKTLSEPQAKQGTKKLVQSIIVEQKEKGELSEIAETEEKMQESIKEAQRNYIKSKEENSERED